MNAPPDDADLLIFMVDIDHFKQVNDTMGHVTGDKLLRVVAERLRSQLSSEDTAARFGGDEFAAILVGREGHAEIENDVKQILAELRRPVTIDDQQIILSVSLGVAIVPHDAQAQEDLLIRADFALYEAKSVGRGAYRFFGDVRAPLPAGPNGANSLGTCPPPTTLANS